MSQFLPDIDYFWIECVKAECVIVPVFLYDGYDAQGDFSPEQLIGLRFVALTNEGTAALENGQAFMMVDDSVSDQADYFLTPREALEAWKNRKPYWG